MAGGRQNWTGNGRHLNRAGAGRIYRGFLKGSAASKGKREAKASRFCSGRLACDQNANRRLTWVSRLDPSLLVIRPKFAFVGFACAPSQFA
jgi:hypothetical protein